MVMSWRMPLTKIRAFLTGLPNGHHHAFDAGAPEGAKDQVGIRFVPA